MLQSNSIDVTEWIDKRVNEVKQSFPFEEYFNSIDLEKGTDVLFMFNPLLGIDLILNNRSIIKSVHFYSEKDSDGIKAFKGKLPFNLEFNFSRSHSREKLGIPNQVGGGDFSFLYGITPPWDKYFYEAFNLHLQFSEDQNKIDLITIDSNKE
jgi:hypothetical protein